ncbi:MULTISPECIES: biotin/lipoyl-containing protein [Acidianus]|uniref:Acetyl/propionyl-CoA carboxylase n=1 Tax=Candidatus Acidianus copahuensis TaxID=1160895 RepID=A0A031LRX9_9CREN|nr:MULTISPECIES: acetyl-CoA carboxylase biotin carboxyl carrier protein subunit [Acidianus]EZQ11107.1 acetyl/propionyl-CoA carboxylase [Candidatus Acidianus copahuensis]NON62089.1 acetyl-CoA carboxylase biotin carboxyl carrier protein subunit [Acidianus sp. RZ1]
MKLMRIYSETGDTYLMSFDTQGNNDKVKSETNEFDIEFLGKGTRENEYIFKVNGEPHSVFLDNGYVLVDNASVFKVERIVELPSKEGQSVEEMIRGREGEVISPLQGRVVMIRVKEGDAVNKGQPLLSVEAMKSETVISAPVAGVVDKILVKQGQGVKKGDTLVLIK